MVKKMTRVGLFLFYRLNIIYSKLVTISKLEPIGKVIICRAMGVIQSLKSKLVKEDIFMDAVYTLNNTLIFYYSTKLPELSLFSINIVYTQYLKKKITSGKKLLAFLQHLAAFCAKCAFRVLQHVAYSIDSAAAFNNAVQLIVYYSYLCIYSYLGKQYLLYLMCN